MERMKRLYDAVSKRFIIHHSSFITHHSSFIILFFGFLFALFTPPFQSPDEPNHFFRAWQVSEGRFYPEKTENRLGGFLPASLSQVSDSFAFLKNDRGARLRWSTWRHSIALPLHAENRQFTDFANTAVYAPAAYLPQAAVIALLRPIGATPLQMLYAARLANLLVWALLISAALQKMPFMRSLLAAVALLPATLCIAASANADVLTNGLCWWLVAALMSGPVAKGFWKKLLAVTAVAANKIITVPLVLAGWFFEAGMQQRNAGAPARRRWPLALLLLAGMLAALWWGRLAQDWFIPYDVYHSGYRDTQTLNSVVAPDRQMDFVRENPGFFLKTASVSLFRALPSMAAHFTGKFGWEKNYLPATWIGLLWLALAALIFLEKNPLTLRQRWGMGMITVLYFGAFALTMYVLWSAVGADRMDNWQGRYFVPVVPVAMMAIARGWLYPWKNTIETTAAVVLIAANIAMAASIWGRYWDI